MKRASALFPAVILASALFLATPAVAEVAAIDVRLKSAGWSLFENTDWKPARFALTQDGAIRVTTEDSTALIWREVAPGAKARRYLSWRWRLDAAMPPTDITVKGGDDRPLAIHVWFEDPPERKSFFASIRAAVLEGLFGIPVSGRVLTYVWGGTGKPGDAQRNPHIGDDSWMIVRRVQGAAPGAERGRWVEERVDLAADFQRGFGEAPPPARIIAIAADSEDTHTASAAFVRDIRFHD